jgi:hypothetical protein
MKKLAEQLKALSDKEKLELVTELKAIGINTGNTTSAVGGGCPKGYILDSLTGNCVLDPFPQA